MAVGGVSESLIIDVSVQDDGATRGLENVKRRAKEAGQETERAFDKANKSATQLDGAVGAISKKFAALGKAAAGIFAADVAARVLGLGSAMELINKAANATADAIRDIGKALLGIKTDHAIGQVRALSEEVSKLRDSLAPSRNLVLPSGDTIPISLQGFNTPEQMLKALDLINAAQSRIQSADDPRERSGQASLIGGASALTRFGAGRLLGGRLRDDTTAQAITRLRTGLDDLRKSFTDATEAAALHKIQLAGLEDQAHATYLSDMEMVRALEQMNRAQEAADRKAAQDRGAFQNDERWNRFARASGGQFAGNAAAFGVGLFQRREAFIESQARGAFSDDQRWNQMSQRSLQGFATGLASLSAELTKAALAKQKFDASFEGGAAEALTNLAENFERTMGSQAVQQTFDSFTGFFFDLFTNVKQADEALKNLGRSLLAVLANQAAQRLALGATNAIFGAFGISQANGGVWRGGINSFAGGGVAYGPQLAMIGDNKSRTEAIVPMPDGRSIPVEMRGGGGTVNFTLNVASLDPRTAESVIMPLVPKIQRQIAGALRGGSDRELTVAIRGAVA